MYKEKQCIFSFGKISKQIIEYLKFNLVGTLVFTICQIIYMILVRIFKGKYLLVYLITNILSSFMIYFLNIKITFKDSEHSFQKFKQIFFINTMEFLPNSILLAICVEVICIPEVIAPLFPPIIMTPFMFILSKFIMKK